LTEKKLVYSGCWNCGQLKLNLVGTQTNQHRHCPKCDYIMDHECNGWGYGKYFWDGFKCSKCGLTIGCGNNGTVDGCNNVYGYGWNIPKVLSREFLRAQRQRIEGLEVVGIN